MNREQEVLQRISRYLMLHGSFTNQIGLLDGKMGIVLFFMHYARYTGIKRYETFAGELIDEIYDEISIGSSRNFGDGLAGIAWGMEYLIRSGFVKANSDEVLEELDTRILERDVRRVKDISLESGLKGIANYIISRCANRNYLPAFHEYILDLLQVLQTYVSTDKDFLSLANQLATIIHKEEPVVAVCSLANFMREITYKKTSLFQGKRNLGISKNGYAGIGLKIMLEE